MEGVQHEGQVLPFLSPSVGVPYQLVNKRSKSTNKDLLQDQNKTISNKGEISQSMNSFFCSIGKDLASNIEGGHDPLIFCDFFLNSN